MQAMGGEPKITDRQIEIGVEQGLGRASVLLKKKSESAGRMAISAAQTAEISEQSGPPESGD
jgi:hypothetical protein